MKKEEVGDTAEKEVGGTGSRSDGGWGLAWGVVTQNLYGGGVRSPPQHAFEPPVKPKGYIVGQEGGCSGRRLYEAGLRLLCDGAWGGGTGRKER